MFVCLDYISRITVTLDIVQVHVLQTISTSSTMHSIVGQRHYVYSMQPVYKQSNSKNATRRIIRRRLTNNTSDINL